MKVAYFSMEIGLNETCPLTVEAWGSLRETIQIGSRSEYPHCCSHILYKRGYFIQNINPLGQQEEMYPYFDPRAFMEPLPFKVTIKIEGRDVHIGVWKYNQIGMHGRVPVYILDTDLPINTADDRLITQFLYGGDQHTRICQEAVLG
jgi:starch phosphorylase